MAKLSHDWRIIFLVVSVALSLWVIHPTYTAEGFQANIQRGFDIQGGARAVLKAEEGTTPEVASQLINIMQTRLNIYGLTDIKIRPTNDLAGNSYIIVEAAGLTEEDVRELLAKEGKFEARIRNQTVLTGKDIQVETYKSGIRTLQGGFRYQVALTVTNLSAAQNFADITRTIPEEYSGLLGGDSYLNETLELYIDNKLVGDPLKISADLKGRVITNPVVEGGAESREDAIKQLEQMTAILQTGALPAKITILSVDSVSPRLGAAFLKNTVIAAFFAVLAVFFVVFLRYRNPLITLAIVSTGLSEVVIILGIASAINWQIDLASIAGIIMIVGTGVDQQIIMTDEVLSGKGDESYSLRQKLKQASFIIFTAFGTTAAAMLPLVFIGLGAVKGFAITSILGLISGIMITRPAYLRAIQYLVEENKI